MKKKILALLILCTLCTFTACKSKDASAEAKAEETEEKTEEEVEVRESLELDLGPGSEGAVAPQ